MEKIKSVYGESCKEIEWTKKYDEGYILQKELVDGGGTNTWLVAAYNLEGDYVGDEKTAEYLSKKGIKAEKSDSKYTVCSIGFCESEQKWYGWSHRAMFGFGIEHITKEGNCECSSGFTEEYLKDHPEEDKSMPVGFECKTLEDCKKCAIAFAESVS